MMKMRCWDHRPGWVTPANSILKAVEQKQATMDVDLIMAMRARR
jgi:hypothetical protein